MYLEPLLAIEFMYTSRLDLNVASQSPLRSFGLGLSWNKKPNSFDWPSISVCGVSFSRSVSEVRHLILTDLLVRQGLDDELLQLLLRVPCDRLRLGVFGLARLFESLRLGLGRPVCLLQSLWLYSSCAFSPSFARDCGWPVEFDQGRCRSLPVTPRVAYPD